MPNNWRQVNDGNSVWFVPEGAYGQYNGQAVYTHGASFGVAQTNNRNLQSATQELDQQSRAGKQQLAHEWWLSANHALGTQRAVRDADAT